MENGRKRGRKDSERWKEEIKELIQREMNVYGIMVLNRQKKRVNE